MQTGSHLWLSVVILQVCLAMATTTIKVPVELRERIGARAKAVGVTAATLLSDLLDEADKRDRWAQVGEMFSDMPPDDDYWEEMAAWDAIAVGATDE